MKKIGKKTTFGEQKGSILIALLVFVVVGITMTSAAIMIMIDSTVISADTLIADQSLMVAESGVENAILRLLRDPSYTGEVMEIEDGRAEVTVTNAGTILINSTGIVGRTSRTVTVELIRELGVWRVISWKEMP